MSEEITDKKWVAILKQEAKRRVYVPMKMMVAAKKFDLAIMNISLAMAKPDFDGEKVFNDYLDAREALTTGLEGCLTMFHRVVSEGPRLPTPEARQAKRDFEGGKPPWNDNDVAKWLIKVGQRRSHRIRLERERNEADALKWKHRV